MQKRNKQSTKSIKNAPEMWDWEEQKYKRLPAPWRMKIRKPNKNEKLIYTTTYIYIYIYSKKQSSFPFQISKEGAISTDV